MSEELGVRGEELIGLLRGCASGSSEFCRRCKLRDYGNCGNVLSTAAAAEIERLRAEREAKKPDTDSEAGWYCCPQCKEPFEIIYPNFCPVCGQKLDWGEDDAES